MNINNSKYEFVNHKSTIWISIFLGILAIITIVIYLNFPSAYNQGIYHYQGLVLKNGGLPYVDFIEKKGPMGLLTYSLAAIFFGETVIGYRIFDLIVLSITAFFLFRLSRLRYSKSISWMAIVFWLQHVLIDGPGNTGDVTNIITACYVALAYVLLVPQIKNRYFLAGLTIALACWVKPTAILIAIPLLLLTFNKSAINNLNRKSIFRFFLGMGVPSVIFVFYLLLSGTFYAFWEVVVLDTVYNYAGNVSRFSFRVLAKTGWTFLNDPVLRIGGLLSLFIFSKNNIIKCIIVGAGLMLLIEGRLYPYQFSILWPFLTFGVVEGFMVLSDAFSKKNQKILVAVFCILMAFPVLKMGSTFIRAGFLTNNFNTVQTFRIEDFKTMYNLRKPVVSYLKKQLNAQDEIFVLGQDPNIYLELGVITTCRLARDGVILIKEPTEETPPHFIAWQQELISYMQSKKADWIIVLKTFSDQWANPYRQKIDSILSKKYILNHTTEGHLIYKKV